MVDELIGQFSPVSFSEWCREQFDRFTADPHAASDAGGFAQAEIVGYVQTLPDGDANRPLLVMAIHAAEKINERSSRRRQFEFARKQLQAAIDKPPAKVKGLFTQGLFAFYDNAGAFRLSLVTGRAEGKKLVYSDFKRQSFFVTQDRNKTFRSRTKSPFGTYQDLAAAFSVEALTKEFYNRLFAWYERAMAPKSKVTFPNDPDRADDDRNLLAEHLIRFITRLMFVWFIQQKKLVPETLFDAAELKRLLKDFDPLSPKQDNYYRAILQNLFFATLNCEIEKRDFAPEGTREENREHYGIKLLYRYQDDFTCTPKQVIQLFKKVPFLNGGLFECLDKKRDDAARSPVLYQDGFSREAKKRAHIPNNLFFDDKGLIALFSLYDFTVDENAPNDADVALDPELLGKVFENLLGAYNPETQETARKQSGSFYTPREIVNYMVEESLVAHLRTQVPDVEESAIRLLLGEENMPDVPKTLHRKLVEALYHCRILDPACGSGAFPMGLLLKMVHLLQRLDPKNTLWHEIVMEETEKALAAAETLDAKEKRARRQRITDSFDQNVNQPDYARKLYLIENCIFGVDIQSIAVQIAKLRAFITLVCDQTPDLTNVAGNYGMLPLPNLETKFVAANSLIGLASDFADGLKSAEGASLLNDDDLVRLRAELAEVRHRHFRARTAPDKNACRKLDRELRGKIKSRLVELAGKPDAAKIALYQAEIESIQRRRKAVEKEDWQDVVHSTPAQTNLFEESPPVVQTMLHMDVNKEKRDKIDDDIRRLTRDIEAEENRAKNKSAFQKEADRLAAWDPYDQNKSSPFFAPQWMFGFKGGFDIVIGNPPYVQLQSLKGNPIQQIYRNLNFKAYDANGDMYCLFYEMGVQVLAPNGNLCFITSNKWMRAGYGEKLRTYFLSYNPRILIDLGPDVFESATVDTNILLIENKSNQRNTRAITIRKDRENKQKPDLGLALQKQGVILSNLDSKAWSIGSAAEQALKAKIERLGKPLKKWDVQINFGIKTGLNEAFIIDKCTRDGLVAEDPKSAEILKPILRGRDINRYNYQWAELWLIATFPALHLRIDHYPVIKRYLIKFGKPRLEQSGKILQDGTKARKLTGNEWFETQDQIAYYPELKKEKLVWKRIGSILRFAYDRDKLYCQDSTCIMTGENLKYLCGYMNSRLGNRLLFDKAPKTGTGDVIISVQALDPLLVPPITSANRPLVTRIETVVDRIIAAKKTDPSADTSSLESEIDRLVYQLFELTPDEIAIVEGREASEKRPATVAKLIKPSTARQPRKSVMTEDPDLA